MGRKRNVGLEAELSDNPETFDADEVEIEKPPAVVDDSAKTPVSVSPLSIPPDALAAFAQMLTQAIQTGTVGAIERTKPVLRETESEQRSVYNPDGNTQARPQLECPTYIGVYYKEHEESGRAPSAIYDYDDAQCTNDEIRALNAMPQGRHLVQMYDGKREPCIVHVNRDMTTGQPLRKIVAFPRECFDKARWNSIPSVREIAQQVGAAAG